MAADSAGTVFRPLLAADLTDVQTLTTSFGWPHRLDDLRFLHRLGFGVAAERAGRLVGMAMGWIYGDHRAAMGSVGVAESARGQGLGRRLVESVLARLGERTVLLHATPDGLSLYHSLGFVETGSVVCQYQGSASGPGLVPLPHGERLRPLGRSDPPLLAALDRRASGMERDALLAAVLDSGTGIVLDRGGEAIGFALLRRFGRGDVIGPAVAPDLSRAKALIGHFLTSLDGQFVRVDVPEESGLPSWLATLGLADAGPAIPMLRGPAAPDPNEPGVRSFALMSQALG